MLPVTSRPVLTRTVLILGLVSLFNDFASDMIVPLIPLLLASVLGAGAMALGAVDGVAEALSSFLKLWSGRASDRGQNRPKQFAFAGYLLSNLVRPLLGLAGSWPVVLVLRSLDRVGKGLRSAPRDAMLSAAAPEGSRGFSFGFHRAMDNIGAVAGSLVVALIFAFYHSDIKEVFYLSALPGGIAVLLLLWGVRTAKTPGAADRTPVKALSWSDLPNPLQQYLVALVFFVFARASEMFLVLRGYELGMSPVSLMLMWSMLNLGKSLTSTWGGKLSDRLGRNKLVLFSWVSFSFSFYLFSWVQHPLGLWITTGWFGLTTGLGEGAERAVIADYAPRENLGGAYGWYYLVVGLASVPAGLAFGTIWQLWGASAAFFVAATFALLACAWIKWKVMALSGLSVRDEGGLM
ncbi:MAG: MFS transporter [Proteobacteria bacterium]|nr:MFS transporter [Pseudomonadota bacterium]MDE3208188.1 MFS transporter [Pseudomonadota bacterium]